MGVLLGDFVVGVVWMKAVCQWSPDSIQKVQDETASFWLGRPSSCALSLPLGSASFEPFCIACAVS